MLIKIIIQIVLILLCAVFSAVETAVIGINDSRLEKLEKEGNRPAKRLSKLLNEPSEFVLAMKTAVTLLGFLSAAFAVYSFSKPLADWLKGFETSISEGAVMIISVLAVTLVVSYLTILFGDIVPRKIAGKRVESIALSMSLLAVFFAGILSPLVWILNFSATIILKVLGIDVKENDENITEEEILMMSDVGAENGTINEDEHRIIKNVFAFDDINVGQICTHRTEVSFLDFDDDDEKWYNDIYSCDSRKMPIYQGNIDKIIGVLDTRKYWKLEDKSRQVVMKVAVSEPYFVHETMKTDVLFDKMRSKNSEQFAVVVDEYGGVSGIITVTDLVEQLVGDFSVDDKDELKEFIEKTGENQWTSSGIISLAQVEEKMGITLPCEEYDTLGEYLMAYAYEFPKDGAVTTIETELLSAKLTSVKNHRIERCVLSPKEPVEE